MQEIMEMRLPIIQHIRSWSDNDATQFDLVVDLRQFEGWQEIGRKFVSTILGREINRDHVDIPEVVTDELCNWHITRNAPSLIAVVTDETTTSDPLTLCYLVSWLADVPSGIITKSICSKGTDLLLPKSQVPLADEVMRTIESFRYILFLPYDDEDFNCFC